ncbi:catenin delta-2-like isoform X2 [Gigantopelta aegis]|uniref:catenin delta-2-like isoform X2 n=2 Tax=Gigantopelta aegis TaxID=1735272 RepID=UPI001B88DC6F|nr:catenin delta-2-like isoform X2 [Gigantopelta aegis]
MPVDHHVYNPSTSAGIDSSYNADESAASILKSVKAQEAHFEHLTRELEAERELVASKIEKSRIGSNSPSMASISSADESFHWRGPPSQQQSYLEADSMGEHDTSKMSSHLLDSCLQELENRGTMNVGEDSNMDYIQEDPYSSSHRMPHHSDPYQPTYNAGSYNPSAPYEREHSPHGSHVSLQSAGSNRPGSRAKGYPQDQQNGNYATYQSISLPVDDLRASPLPGTASPLGPDPSRFTPNHLPVNYRNLSPHGSVSRYSEDSQPGGYHPQTSLDQYDSFGPRDPAYADNRNNYQVPPDHGASPYRGQDPRYPDYEDQYPEPQYRDQADELQNPTSPVRDLYNGAPRSDEFDRYGDQPPIPDSQYPEPLDHSRDQSYHNDDYGSRPPQYYDDDHQNRYPNNEPSYHDDPQNPRYGDYPNDSFQGPAAAPGERYSYQDPLKDQYPSHQDDQYGGEPVREDNPPYNGNYPNDSINNEPRYRDSVDHPDDPYRDKEPDLYGGQSPGPSLKEDRRSPAMYQDPYANHPGDDPSLIHKIEGLPPLRQDPFADDPFQQQKEGLRPNEEDPYHRGPSPSQGPGPYEDQGPSYGDQGPPYGDQGPPYGDRSYDDRDGPSAPYDSSAPPHYDYQDNQVPLYPEDEVGKHEGQMLGAPVDRFSDGHRTPSDGGQHGTLRWRDPDLQEVIDYLSHYDVDVRSHAAAYLQHLCFMDDGIKAKTRGLDGIRPLINLLSHEYPEVHRNACGALQNLSYGKTNDENKKAIKNAGGIPELVRLLRKTQDGEVKESITGILWNLSSCEDLKKPIIDSALAVLVNSVIIPHSGWDRLGSSPEQQRWTLVFRNATGVIRNVSSAGYEARKKLRECRGLVNSLLHTLKSSQDNDMDSKPVENIVCVFRNLSYRIQEVEDPEFYKKRTLTNQPVQKNDKTTGCFGGGKSKKGSNKGADSKTASQKGPPQLPPGANEYKALWGMEILQVYSALLKHSSNEVTLEASAGAIQNLTACDWQPAVEIRASVRKEKGLPHLVDLLTFPSDRVVCAAATALRNLAIDERNKELVGKYAMQQLVRKLPQQRNAHPTTPDDTLCAVIATLYEILKNQESFAQSFFKENGLPRLMNITKSEGQYLARTIKYAGSVLKILWSFKFLHQEYNQKGYTERDFLQHSTSPRPEGSKPYSDTRSAPSSNHTTPYNTLSRPMSAQGYDDNTLTPGRPMQKRVQDPYGSRTEMDGYLAMNQSNSRLNADSGDGYYDTKQVEDIPLTEIGPGYTPIDEPRQHRTKPPVGGVPLFPSVPPSEPTPPDLYSDDPSSPPEPLYAQVKKGNRRRNDDYVHTNKLMLDSSGPEGGADSWV